MAERRPLESLGQLAVDVTARRGGEALRAPAAPTDFRSETRGMAAAAPSRVRRVLHGGTQVESFRWQPDQPQRGSGSHLKEQL